MAFEVIKNMFTAISLDSEEQLMRYIAYLFFFWAACVLISLQNVTAPYGRYQRPGWGFSVPVKFAWIVQELPSVLMPLLLMYFSPCPKLNNPMNLFAVGLFLFHYCQRTFIFPLLLRGGKDTPLIPFVLAFLFCVLNGYLQGGYLLKFADLEFTPITAPRIVVGTVLFFAGFTINVHSDSTLRNLRTGSETGYKIPRGGMFEYVSGANFFGEILEWFGFFVVCWSLPSLAFFIFTASNIGPRACQHHRWYKEKFEDYPKKRKALIPFVF